MSPLRGDVLAVGFLLALPLVAVGLRGDLTAGEVTARLPWCLIAGYVVVALLRFAGKPRGVAGDAASEQTARENEPFPAP
jgi:hypothetical protein